MPSKIQVITGRDAERAFDIESEVVTIGGHPGCDICLAGEPETVAAIRFRDGAFSVYNRADESLIVDGTPVPAGGVSPWRPGKILQLPSGVRLKLDIVGDPAPVRNLGNRPAEDEPDEPENNGSPPQDASASEAKAKSDRLTWALLAILVVMIFLAIPSDDAGQPSRNARAEFQELVYALLPPEVREVESEAGPGKLLELRPEFRELSERVDPEERPVLDNIRERLQSARIAELRGNRARAMKHYGELRDLLLLLGVDRRLAGTDLDHPVEVAAVVQAPQSLYDVAYRFVMREIQTFSE